MLRILLSQFHIDIVRTCPDLPALRVKQHDIFGTDDPVECSQVLLVIKLRILFDQFRHPPGVLHIKRFSRTLPFFQVICIVTDHGFDHFQCALVLRDLLIDRIY